MQREQFGPFGFPYAEPYSVQLDLMTNLTEFLQDQNAKLGLFESPTGTVSINSLVANEINFQGKTLSMLCALISHHLGLTEQTTDATQDDDDWLSNFGKVTIDQK